MGKIVEVFKYHRVTGQDHPSDKELQTSLLNSLMETYTFVNEKNAYILLDKISENTNKTFDRMTNRVYIHTFSIDEEEIYKLKYEEKEGVRILDEQAIRVETGLVKFGEDWNGLFFRGDNAVGIGLELQAIANSTVMTKESKDNINGLAELFLSVNQNSKNS